MRQTFTIPGRFVGLNEFYRADRWEQSRLKREAQERIGYSALAARLKPMEGRLWLGITYHEQNKRRDLDNVSATARKFILDALQEVGVIGDDKQVEEITDALALDRKEPRIVVTLGNFGQGGLMLGRHNITIYADELERCIGGIKAMEERHAEEMCEEERCYWLGVRRCLAMLHETDLPDDWQAFIASMQVHFEGGAHE